MTPFVQNLTNFASLATLVIDILAVFLIFILITPLRKIGWTRRLVEFLGENAIMLGFLVASLATVGSLFYEFVAGFAPCELCWWIRIFLYPQTFLLFVALFYRNEHRLARVSAVVLSFIGVIISFYHELLQTSVIGNDLIPCDASGVSCQHVYFIQYGYITIPAMALTAFVLILLFMFSPHSHRGE